MGCCLCTSNQTVVSSIQRESIINCERAQVNLRPLRSYKCDCLYSCGGDQFIYYLKLSFPISIKIFDSLIERGFVRNSDYFRKYDTNSCCCIGYNIRINIKNHLFTYGQQKIIKKFITKYIPQITKNQLERKDSLQSIEDQPNKKKSILIENKNTIIKQNVAVSNSQLIECILEIQILLENNKKQIIQQLELEQFISKIENLQNLKIFESQTPYIYYSNFNLILFDQNKRFSKHKKLSQENLNQMLNHILTNQIFQENYKIIQGSSGYFTFFDLKNVNTNLIKNIEKQKKKQKNRKKKLQNSQNPLKQEDIKFIDKTTQAIVVNQLNEFNIGDLNIQIIEPMYNQEVFTLYQNYMNEVHKSQVDEESFQRYYATVITEKNYFIFSTNSQQRLNLGQKYMQYRIKGKLIACGVILLLSNILISEYLFYDPILKPYGFGIFSTFVEIEYVKIIQKHFPDFIYHSLSYVIVNNKSMNYKLQFLGLEIQCPQTYQWLKYTDEIKVLIQNNTQQLDFQLKDQKNQFDLDQCLISINGEIVQVKTIQSENRLKIIQILEQYQEVLGNNLMNQLVFIQTNE